VGLDSLLAHDCRRNSDRDRLAREVSESAAVLLDSAVGMAFLVRLRRDRLGSPIVRHPVPRNPDGETLI